jgi:hypothetical protein
MKQLDIPTRMQHLPRDAKGRPIPFFVHIPPEGGEPDFRIAGPNKIAACHNQELCWVCGTKTGVHKAFVLGPMCVINRVSAEPPSHYVCARYSVQACPFLSTPRMHRREADLPDEFLVEPAGIASYRNPGAAAIWVTKTYHLINAPGGVLFRAGAPERVEWYCEGRAATRQEIMDSISSGFPQLEKLAEEDGPEACKKLEKDYRRAMELLPV